MSEVKKVGRRDDGTYIGELDGQLYVGVKRKVPLQELSFENVDNGDGTITNRTYSGDKVVGHGTLYKVTEEDMQAWEESVIQAKKDGQPTPPKPSGHLPDEAMSGNCKVALKQVTVVRVENGQETVTEETIEKTKEVIEWSPL